MVLGGLEEQGHEIHAPYRIHNRGYIGGYGMKPSTFTRIIDAVERVQKARRGGSVTE
jgi:hypothetical protein